jgi:hypothetical protein
MRVSDYTRSLAALRLKATIVVLDAARASPFTTSDQPLAGGLALVEPDPGMLIAFNAAPSTVAPEAQSDYRPYAKSLAEMIRDAGVSLVELSRTVSGKAAVSTSLRTLRPSRWPISPSLARSASESRRRPCSCAFGIRLDIHSATAIAGPRSRYICQDACPLHKLPLPGRSVTSTP